MYDDKDIPFLGKAGGKKPDVYTLDDPTAVLSSWDLSMGIINALVGTAVLTFPHLTYKNGIPIFSLIFTLCGFTMFGSLILLAKCSVLAGGEVSLHELTRIAFERKDGNSIRSTFLSKTLPIIVDIFLLVDCFFGNVVYINFIAHFAVASNSVIHGLPSSLTLFDYKVGIGVIGITLTVATGDALSELRLINIIGFMALVLTTFFTITSPFWLSMELHDVISPDASSEERRLLDMCEAFSICGYALVNYFCATSFYAETKNKTRFTPVVFLTFAALVGSFILYGVFGAASIGSGTFFAKEDIADIFPYYYVDTTYTSDLMKKISGVVFIALSMTLITKIPIYTLPMVDGVKEIYMQLMPGPARTHAGFEPDVESTEELFGWKFNMLLKLVFGAIQLIVALFLNSLSLIMNLDGAFVLTPLSYLIPAAIYIRLSKKKKKRSTLLFSFACFIVGIGTLLWVYAIVEFII